MTGVQTCALPISPKFPNIPVSLQGNTEIPGVSREVPCSVLKCETVLDTLDATAKAQARILEWFAISSPRDQTLVSYIGRQILHY